MWQNSQENESFKIYDYAAVNICLSFTLSYPEIKIQPPPSLFQHNLMLVFKIATGYSLRNRFVSELDRRGVEVPCGRRAAAAGEFSLSTEFVLELTKDRPLVRLVWYPSFSSRRLTAFFCFSSSAWSFKTRCNLNNLNLNVFCAIPSDLFNKEKYPNSPI